MIPRLPGIPRGRVSGSAVAFSLKSEITFRKETFSIPLFISGVPNHVPHARLIPLHGLRKRIYHTLQPCSVAGALLVVVVTLDPALVHLPQAPNLPGELLDLL